MRPTSSLFLAVPQPADRLPEALLSLIQELTAVMAEENALLAAGLPTAVAGTADRKVELSDRFDHLWAGYAGRCRLALVADQDTAHRLIQAVTVLRKVATENVGRLDAALAASRRRIDTAMTAMRGDVAPSRGYGTTGAVPLVARLPVATTILRA